jgi:hypothetical protein
MTSRSIVILVAAVFLGWIAVTLLASGWIEHRQDGGTHLDLLIGGVVFGLIALAGVGRAVGVIAAGQGKRAGRQS